MSPFWMAVEYLNLTPDQRATCVFSYRWKAAEYKEMRYWVRQHRAFYPKYNP
jgi:hypothetical protein